MSNITKPCTVWLEGFTFYHIPPFVLTLAIKIYHLRSSVCITLILAFLLLPFVYSYGQTVDSTVRIARNSMVTRTDTVAKQDSASWHADTTVPKHKPAFQPKPKKAGLYSAIIPGMGQLYNRQYWKLPIVYAAAGAAVYLFNDNLQKFHKYRKLYLYRLSGGAPTAEVPYDAQTLKQVQDQYRRNLDLTGLFSALGYTLQVIDAVAAAHLKNFDISRDISMRFQPVTAPYYVGLGVVVDLK